MPKLLVVEVDPSGECKKTQYKPFIERGYDLHFLIGSAKNAHLYQPNVRIVPGHMAQDFVDAATVWHEQVNFDAVVTLTEFSVIATSLIASAIGKPGVDLAAALVCRNKFHMRQAHEKGDVRHPAFALVHDTSEAAAFADHIGYPVVIKPTLGAGSEHIYKITNRNQMFEYFPKAVHGISIHSYADSEPRIADRGPNGLLVEAYLNGNEHSLEAWVWDGRVTIGAIGDRLSPEANLFDNDIYTMPTRLTNIQIEEICRLVEKAAKAQGITRGVLHPEIRYHEGVPFLVEMGARAGGGPISHMTREAYGYCPVTASFDIASGIKPTQPAMEPTGKVVLAIAMICEEGRIEHVSIPPEAENSRNLIYFKIFLSPGDINLRPPHGNILLGQICAVGDTLEEAYQHADSIYKRVAVTLRAIN